MENQLLNIYKRQLALKLVEFQNRISIELRKEEAILSNLLENEVEYESILQDIKEMNSMIKSEIEKINNEFDSRINEIYLKLKNDFGIDFSTQEKINKIFRERVNNNIP